MIEKCRFFPPPNVEEGEEGEERKCQTEKIPTLPFLDIYIKKKNQHMIHFLVHGYSNLVHIPFSPSEVLKAFRNAFPQKLDHKSVTMKWKKVV